MHAGNISRGLSTWTDRILVSFRKTTSLSRPNALDIEEYRAFLAVQAPIAEVETHFLDDKDDLVVFEDGEYGEYGDLSTPMPRNAHEGADFEDGILAEGVGQGPHDDSRTSSPTVPGFDQSLRPAISQDTLPNPKGVTPSWDKWSATILSSRLESVAYVMWAPVVVLFCWYIATR
jgi:hypothetical protein